MIKKHADETLGFSLARLRNHIHQPRSVSIDIDMAILC